MADFSTHTAFGLPGFIQDAALFALQQGPALEQAVAAPCRRRRDLALDILSGSKMIDPVASGGAVYLMLDIRGTGLTGVDFANALLDAERIGVMPGESFGAAAEHVCLALTVPDAVTRNARFAKGAADAA